MANVEWKRATPPVPSKGPLVSVATEAGVNAIVNGHSTKPAPTRKAFNPKVAAKQTPLKGVQMPLPLEDEARPGTKSEPKALAKALSSAANIRKALGEKPANKNTTKTKVQLGAAKPAAKPAPTKPPVKHPLHKALKKEGFNFLKAERAGKEVAYAYQHKDQRAALLLDDGGIMRWAYVVAGHRKDGVGVDALAAELRVSPARQKARDERAAVVDGTPPHVLRAVTMLGGLTRMKFDVDSLRGDKHYGPRMALLKKLFNRDRVLASECGLNNVREAFYTAVGVADGKSAASRAEAFAARCKEITRANLAVAGDRAREEKKVIAAAKRADTSRFVPGTILPGAEPKSKAQRKAEESATAREVYALAITAEPLAAPRPDAPLLVAPSAVRLLEDPINGIVMMQLEPANSQGAICVYNNGVRVAAGVVPPEKLKTLRPLTGPTVDLHKAAHQLLNPLVPSVPVTPVAARHLTAVIHCKELKHMATEETTAKKFAAPAAAKKAANKTEKATPKASKKSIATGKEKAARQPAEDRKIKALVKAKDVTLREGTFCYSQVHAALASKTVSEAQATLDKDKNNPSKGRRIEIAWLVKKGFISVS